MATTHLTEWIEEIERDPEAHKEWHAKYKNHFGSGQGLPEIVSEMKSLGVMNDHHAEYFEAIPPEVHAEIAEIINHYLNRDERWSFRWHHRAAPDFALQLNVHPKERVVWLVLVGPHGDDEPVEG